MRGRWILPLLLIAARLGGAEGAEPQYPTLYDAIYKLNLTTMQYLLNLSADLTSRCQNPSTQVILMAPSSKANFEPDFKWGWSLVAADKIQFLYYYFLPWSTPQGQLDLSTDITVPTLWPLQDQATTLVNMTIRKVGQTDDAICYGLAPGGRISLLQSYTAGQSRIYLVDNPVIPPSMDQLPTNKIVGLTLRQGLDKMDPALVSTFSQLIQADPFLLAYAKNPDNCVTYFIPTSASLNQYISDQGFTMDQFVGSDAARALVLTHILPDRAYMLRSFTIGTTAIQTLNTDVYVLVTAGTSNVSSSFGIPVVTVSWTGNFVPRSVLYDSSTSDTSPRSSSNIWAGKSAVHVISGPILVPPKPPAPSPSPSPPLPVVSRSVPPPKVSDVVPAPAPEAPAAPDDGSSHTNLALVGGVIAGAVVGAGLIAAAIVVFIIMRRRKLDRVGWGSRRPYPTDAQAGPPGLDAWRKAGDRPAGDLQEVQVFVNAGQNAGQARNMDGRKQPSGRRTKTPVQVQGFIYGDPFVRSAAPQYTWVDVPPNAPPLPGVEAGINDAALDTMMTGNNAPITRLSRADVVNQISLLNIGPIGRGASAIVFKCQWPARFGPDACLAIKVLKDPYEADPAVFESFCYEAAVLASVRHPNVVRMYAYCLELPTACIIMELCPGTLRDRLYRRLPDSAASRSASQTQQIREHSAGTQGAGANNTKPVMPLRSAVSSQLAPHPPTGTSHHSGSEGRPEEPTPPVATTAALAAAAGAMEEQSTKGAATLPMHAASSSHSSTIVVPPLVAPADGAAPVAAASTSSKPVQYLSLYNHLTMVQVLQLIADVAAGLAYLHKRPAVMALPVHPTAMLEAPLSDSDDASTLPPMTPHAPAAIEEDEEEDDTKAVARIVHRDLKPSNILVSSQGRCKISDFGLARWHNNTSVHTSTLGVGTLRYMAPELLLGHFSGHCDHNITNRVDIYSLGMLCWEMATSQMPWSDLTDAQIVAAVISQKRPTLEGVNPESVTPASSHPSGDAALMALMRAHHLSLANHLDGSLPELPDSLANFPELMAIITCCWQQQDSKRPTAQVVHRVLCTLLCSYGQNAGSAGSV